jgi:integrase
MAWDRLIRRTSITNLRFHDLRHEAISRFFEMGLSMPEVALISGHKDPRMLFRYTHLDPERVIAKLVLNCNGTAGGVYTLLI